jgi:hypothetical protein
MNPTLPTARLPAQAIFLEAVGTGLLLFVIYGTAVDPRGAKAVSHMAPLAIGMSYSPLPLSLRTCAAAAAAFQSVAGHGIGVPNQEQIAAGHCPMDVKAIMKLRCLGP